jgi:hypothetical protein
MNYTYGSMLALLSVAAIGCGGAAVPQAELTSSQSAIRAAEEVGANNLPQAELHLKFAKDQVEKAKALIADDDNEEAKRVLMRAQADAELAISLAKESSVRAEAHLAMQQVEQLRQKAQ